MLQSCSGSWGQRMPLPRVESALLAPKRELTWVGAVSFEERSTASLESLLATGATVRRVIALEYATTLRPARAGQNRRDKVRDKLRVLARSLGCRDPESVEVHPYTFESLVAGLQQLAPDSTHPVVVDVSCLTKLHVIALGCHLSSRPPNEEWFACYTTPQNYTIASAETYGWQDILVVPLADSPTDFVNERNSRGVILAGHEGDRLNVSFHELEAAGGSFVYIQLPGRPDLRLRSTDVNRPLYRELTRRHSSAWSKVVISQDRTDQLLELIEREVAAARRFSSPLVLYPYGPSAAVLNATMRLCQIYQEASWFVYAVPSGYDVNYTEGSGRTYWYKVAQS